MKSQKFFQPTTGDLQVLLNSVRMKESERHLFVEVVDTRNFELGY